MGTVICTICKRREAFFFRPYSGEKLCKKCFSISVEDKVRATVAKYDMLKYNDRIAVAVSGGKDSLSLLHILAKIERSFLNASLVAVSVDEGIRGYRDKAIKMAAENCKELDVEHFIVSFKELYGYAQDEIVKRLKRKESSGLTPCAYCGVLRRKALNIAAREVNANKIATGHTLDDETQTILLNILHGAPLRMAREKPLTDKVHPKLVQRIKPFCGIPERETTLYAYTKKMRFQDTSCPYASEAMRNPIRLFLNRMEHKHAGTKFTIFKSIEKIRPAIEKIVKKEELNECIKCGEPTTERICKACQMLQELGMI
jgi:uncharacterized protein (TIGR00269 family)